MQRILNLLLSKFNKHMHTLNLQEAASMMGMSFISDAQFCGVSVDSRLHQSSNLFFALPGAKSDGHQHLQEIASKGAAGAVVKKDYKGPDFGLTLIYVEDPLESLQTLGKQLLQKSKARIVAVTGSVGKTTTKDFITTVLKEKYRVASSPGNSNSQIGVPLTILNHTDGQEEILVLEMGMTHPGNIRKLLDIAPPECALITNVALVHACNFSSLEDIARAKSEILEHPRTKIGIVHRGIANYSEMAKVGSCKKISFAENDSEADYFLHSNSSDDLEINFQGEVHGLGPFPVPGKHNRINFLAVVACARYLGLSWENITSGMRKLVLPALRWQSIHKNGIHFINDSYNASPIAVKAALENMPQPPSGGRKVAVLADMLELGQFSEKSHREIGRYALDFVDQMFCYGSESRYILDTWQKAARPVQWFSQREDLIRCLHAYLQAGDVVLIKGSRSTQLSKLLDEMETLIT
jgi:UDP-N-acetylmuramoyl-tripeptide--D-alanyl-D-alanine ligase